MRLARRAIAILTGFATGFIAAATVAYAAVAPIDSAVVPNPPPVGDQWWNAAPATTSTSAAGLPLWQLLAFVALGVLLAVVIVGLGYSLSHSQRSQPSPRSQTPLRS
jgi:hypothetical protein